MPGVILRNKHLICSALATQNNDRVTQGVVVFQVCFQDVKGIVPTPLREDENVHGATTEIMSVNNGFVVLVECLNQCTLQSDEPVVLID